MRAPRPSWRGRTRAGTGAWRGPKPGTAPAAIPRGARPSPPAAVRATTLGAGCVGVLLPLIENSLKRPEHHFGQLRPFAREDNDADSAMAIYVDVPVNLCPSGLAQPFQWRSRGVDGRFGPRLTQRRRLDRVTLRLHRVPFGEMFLI